MKEEKQEGDSGYLRDWFTWMFDQATTMGDGSHRCGPNPLCPDRIESKCRAEIGGRSPVQSSTDTPGTSASTPTSSSEDGHDKLLGVDPDYCRRILVRGGCRNKERVFPSSFVSISSFQHHSPRRLYFKNVRMENKWYKIYLFKYFISKEATKEQICREKEQ